ncbi:MAG: alanyl-tRNA editing protein [Roseobacter sp.]
MTKPLFLADAYVQRAQAKVLEVTSDGGIVPDASVFYPTGGGQPGDRGVIHWNQTQTRIATTVKGADGRIVLVPEDGQEVPLPGTAIEMVVDWPRRYRLMRVHTALHLLSVAIPFGVTGGAVGEGKGRLDFDMAEPPEDKEAIAKTLNAMIATDALVSEMWITDAALEAQPELVKTMKVKPPRGTGRVRLVRIGDAATPMDLQPCGGTHVRRLGEIGTVKLGKVEKKGRQNRRVYLHLDATD